MSSKVLLNSKEIEIILHRLACQRIENHNDFSNTVLIGLQPRGVYLANRIKDILTNDYNIKDLKLGLLVKYSSVLLNESDFEYFNSKYTEFNATSSIKSQSIYALTKYFTDLSFINDKFSDFSSINGIANIVAKL